MLAELVNGVRLEVALEVADTSAAALLECYALASGAILLASCIHFARIVLVALAHS